MNFGKPLWALLVGSFVCTGFAAVEFREADITTVKNIVEKNEGSGAMPAKVNDKVTEKSVVSTAASSMAELTFADSSITRMGANTQFSFKSKERLVKLEQGTILIHTPPGNGGATVDAGGVTAAVSGTTFMASRDGVGNVLFVLLEGQGGLKVTAGGSTTVIRPGQAASVGAESVKELAATASSEKTTPTPAAGSANPGGDEKGPGQAPGAAPAADGGNTGGTPPPAPAAAPKIQVFDIDVKRVVTTSPLVVDFKSELPSASKIEKTIETQQQAVKEGKLEKLEVEAVAVKTGDGDLLVGAPKVEKEEFVIVNKKLDVVGKAQGGDGLDIETAAGPGAGPGTGGGMAATPAPRVETLTIPPAVTPPVNPGQTALQPPPPPAQVAVAARVNDVSRPFNQENPNFGFSITSGSLLTGHSLVTDFLTSAVRTSGVSGSPYSVNFSNPRIVDSSGTDVSSRYNLTTSAGLLNVLKASQSVDFDSVGSLTFGQEANLVAQALAGDVRYEVVSGPGSVVNGKLVANSGTGSVVVRAVTTGNDNYNSALAEQTITLAKAGQSVSFSPLPSALTYNTGAGLTASALDSGTVSFQVVSGPGTIDSNGRLVATSGTGSVVVRATAAGDQNYNSALAEQTITLAKAGQEVDMVSLSGSLIYEQDFGLVGMAGGLTPVSFEVVSGPGRIANGRLIPDSGTGSVVVRVSTLGNDNFLGASAEKTFVLGKAAQNLTLSSGSFVVPGIAPSFQASVTGVRVGTPNFAVGETDGRATVDAVSGAVTLGRVLGADSYRLTATVPGNDNFNPASVESAFPIIYRLTDLETANPARRLLTVPGSGTEMEALDKFFFYHAKASDFTGDAPSAFFATSHQSKNLSLSQIDEAKLSQLVPEIPGSVTTTPDYFFMGNLAAGTAAVPEINLQNRDRVIYADTVRIDPAVGSARTLGETSLSLAVPDGNPAGLARHLDLSTQGLTGSFSWFVDEATLRIDGKSPYGAFSGDFISYLRHAKSDGGTELVYLLDRIGTTSTDADGSSANGLNVTFNDFANSAIHQATSTDSSGAISGTYQPDRGASSLTTEIGPVHASGQLTLGVFDMASGAEGLLQSWSIRLVERLAISLDNGAGKNFTLAAGDGGLFLKNTLWDLGGTRAEFVTTGNLFLESDSFFFPGNSLRMEAAGSADLVDVRVLGNAAASSEVVVRARQDVTLTDTAIKEVGGTIEVASLNGPVELLASKTIGTQTVSGNVDLQAEKVVKITGATVVDLDTSAGAKPADVSGTSSPGYGYGPQNLAVVRSGDSLELRNVVIRGFHGTRLENGAGRVLMSGSSVRDFKIKELVGAAVNADSKIQMAALDALGGLEGEMLVEKGLPVAKISVADSADLQAKLGTTELSEMMNDPRRRDVKVDASQVDLAARKITFDNASVAALNSITARANTIVVQDSFMTVMRNSGMINMYVQTGRVNPVYGQEAQGYANFIGRNVFQVGNTSIVLNNSYANDLGVNQLGTNLLDVSHHNGTPQAGKVNVLKL